MSERMEVDEEATLREFKLELEMLIATMLPDVSIAAIKKFFGSDDMSQIVAKALAPMKRHVRRR